MLPGLMSPMVPMNTDDLTNQPLKFGRVLTSNIRDMAFFVFINYRNPPKKKFTNPVVHIAASMQIGFLFG